MVGKHFEALTNGEKIAYSLIAIALLALAYVDTGVSGSQKAFFVVIFALVSLLGLSTISRLNVIELEHFKK